MPEVCFCAYASYLSIGRVFVWPSNEDTSCLCGEVLSDPLVCTTDGGNRKTIRQAVEPGNLAIWLLVKQASHAYHDTFLVGYHLLKAMRQYYFLARGCWTSDAKSLRFSVLQFAGKTQPDGRASQYQTYSHPARMSAVSSFGCEHQNMSCLPIGPDKSGTSHGTRWASGGTLRRTSHAEVTWDAQVLPLARPWV